MLFLTIPNALHFIFLDITKFCNDNFNFFFCFFFLSFFLIKFFHKNTA